MLRKTRNIAYSQYKSSIGQLKPILIEYLLNYNNVFMKKSLKGCVLSKVFAIKCVNLGRWTELLRNTTMNKILHTLNVKTQPVLSDNKQVSGFNCVVQTSVATSQLQHQFEAHITQL